MTTVTDANVHNIADKGTFDDCQVRLSYGRISFSLPDSDSGLFLNIIRTSSRRGELHKLGSHPRSTVYYFLSYFHFRAQLPSNAGVQEYVVLTGNFGDILAGYFPKRLRFTYWKIGCSNQFQYSCPFPENWQIRKSGFYSECCWSERRDARD